MIIIFLSGYPGNKIPKEPFFGFDKVVHISVYFCYTLTLLYGVLYSKNNRKLTFKLSLIVSIFGILYGGFMEILQHYIFINRSGNWYDFLANSIGVIIGALFFPFIKNRYL